LLAAGLLMEGITHAGTTEIGKEISASKRLQYDDEFRVNLQVLIGHDKELFEAN
jgi:hypothetical protein